MAINCWPWRQRLPSVFHFLSVNPVLAKLVIDKILKLPPKVFFIKVRDRLNDRIPLESLSLKIFYSLKQAAGGLFFKK